MLARAMARALLGIVAAVLVATALVALIGTFATIWSSGFAVGF